MYRFLLLSNGVFINIWKKIKQMLKKYMIYILSTNNIFRFINDFIVYSYDGKIRILYRWRYRKFC